MNSITQIYTLEFKKLLKNKILTLIENVTDSLIENIFLASNSKYIKILRDLEDSVKELIIKILIETINFFDDKFLKSKERKKYYHINVRHDHRGIQTAIGYLEYNRTYYETKDRKEHFYFIDELLGIDKYARYDCNVKANAINLTTKTNQKIAGEITLSPTNNYSSYNNYVIPRQTIYRWIKEWQIPKIIYEPINIQGDTLYVMADEKWIHEQIYNRCELDKNKHKFIMSKEFVCFSGIEQKGKRRILKDRFVFITASNTTWVDFTNIVTQIYDFEKLNKIVFLSDGGKWLVSGAPELKMYEHNVLIMCLCEFHARQNINRITTNEEYRNILNKFIDDDKKKEFKNFMNKIKKENPTRLNKLIDYEKYILNNWNKIKNMLKSPCKSSMESHISHYIASYFSSRPKAYSRNTIENYLKLQEAKINGIDIKNLYLMSYKNLEKDTYNQKELNFSIFEKSSSNIPIIQSGKYNPIFCALSKLSHI